MKRRVLALALAAVCMLALVACEVTEETVPSTPVENNSIFDFSLGEYLGEKTESEMLDMLNLSSEDNNGLNVYTLNNSVMYEGKEFVHTVYFNVLNTTDLTAEIIDSHLFNVSYTFAFPEGADVADVLALVETLYSDMVDRYGIETMQDDITAMLQSGSLSAGVVHWELPKNEDGLLRDMLMYVEDLAPTAIYRVGVQMRLSPRHAA